MIIFTAGMFNWIDCETELFLHNIFDIFSKLIYARTLCTAHGTTLSPEDILNKMLLLEEQSNAAIRMFLRFIILEVSTPINTILLGVENLRDQKISEEGSEMLALAQEQCFKISEMLTSVRQFQESNDNSISMDFEMTPFSLKDCIRRSVRRQVENARKKNVKLLLAGVYYL